MGTDAIALDEKNKAYFKKKKIRKYIFVSLMLIYPLLQFAIFWVYININTVLLSFQRYSFMTQQWKWIGFDNYRILFREFTQEYSVLRLAVRNSILFFPFNNFVLLPISVICAFILHKKVFMHSVFRVIFFFPSIISIHIHRRADNGVRVHVRFHVRARQRYSLCARIAKYHSRQRLAGR